MDKVRFAPSPTGNLHIGGARTALFNWIYARSTGANFVLRIEDTDKLRSEKQYLDEILESLQWLGFSWDEIHYQSQRFELYRQYAERLLKEGSAYEEDSPKGGKAIIFKVEPKAITVNDEIRGPIEFDTSTIKDQVLIKSDGTPTYNFACVIDDALMGITHVIRGDDHISNTPKQVLLYEALGLALPKFAHLPLILAKGGGRLSKRKGATAISDYRKAGYLSEAVVNYLLLLGWSPGENREVIDIKEAIKIFGIKDINKTAAVLDLDKLDWMNNQYLKKSDPSALAEQLVPLLEDKGLFPQTGMDMDYLISIVKLFQGRMTTVTDFPDWADFFFLPEPKMDAAAAEKFLGKDLSREFSLFCQRLDGLKDFTVETIEEAFRKLVEELGTTSKALIHPIRVALTGKTVGPGLFEVIYYLGRDRTKSRLSKFVKKE